MKRILFAFIMVGFSVFSWYSVINTYKNGSNEFQKLISSAQLQYEKKVYDSAEELYKSALNLQPNDEEALLGLANTYFSQEEYDSAASTCEQILKTNKDCNEALLLEAKSLMSGGKYSNTLKILNGMERTEQINTLILDVKSRHSLSYINGKNPKNWLTNSPLSLYISIIYENDSPHAYNSQGKRIAKGEISYLGPISEDKQLYPAVEEGVWCFVDSSGKRKLVPDTSYEFLGPFNNGYAVAKKGEKFGYVDASFNEYFFECEKAYNFYEGKAVVKIGEKVEIIDTSFNVVVSTEFTDVEADEYGYTNHFGKSVFIDSGKYFLCDTNGKKISSLEAEYIGLPMEKDGMVEFKQNGKYGFLNSTDGTIAINAKFDSAKAFSKGIAPVEIDEKWGFIDSIGQQIIEPEFKYASSVSDKGTAWIENEAGLALLTFYHLSED